MSHPRQLWRAWTSKNVRYSVSPITPLLNGRDQSPLFMGIVMRFWEKSLGISGHIKKVFYQVTIWTEDQNEQQSSVIRGEATRTLARIKNVLFWVRMPWVNTSYYASEWKQTSYRPSRSSLKVHPSPRHPDNKEIYCSRRDGTLSWYPSWFDVVSGVLGWAR